MASVNVPFRGGSTPRLINQTLTDQQLGLLDRLSETCMDWEAEVMGEAGEESLGLGLGARRGRATFIAGRQNRQLDQDMVETAAASLKGGHASQEMMRFRESLPSFQMKAELLTAISRHQVVVVSGETGCGKTTQLPQFLLDQAVQAGRGSTVSVVVTQPRRVAAISVAERVATERGERLGCSVGYQVRMDHKLPREQGSILYCTAGILLQRMQSDRSLKQFTHVVLDEIHERDIMADLIMVILKQVLPQRPEIKLILMSATLNASQFSRYLSSCPTLHIPGFMHPVTPFYLEDVLEMTEYNVEDGFMYDDSEDRRKKGPTSGPPVLNREIVEDLKRRKKLSQRTVDGLLHPRAEDLNMDLLSVLVYYIHTTQPPGAILVFLPGWEDISALSSLLSSSFQLSQALVLCLHGSMSPADQALIFNKPQPGFRKIVIATNIAESSITINDIVYVIDSGRAKIKMFDPEKNFATLQPEWISKANATQRAGRSGRLQPGKVFKLYSKAREQSMADHMAPEMIRSRLENVILKIKVLGYDDVNEFLGQLMDPPNPESVRLSNESLLDIGALNKDLGLTGLGHTLGQLPLDPQLGKMMVLGAAFSCLDPVLSVACCLDHKSPFHLPPAHKTKELGLALDRLARDTVSDHLAVANAVAAWDGLSARGGQARDFGVQDFCHENFLSQRVLRSMDKMKYQYALELNKLGLTPSTDPKDPRNNSNSAVEALVRAVVCIGLLPNVAHVLEDEEEGGKIRLVTTRAQTLEFHPRSVNRDVMRRVASSSWASSIPRWFTFFEKMHSSDTFIHDSTAVGPMSLLLLASNISFIPHPSPSSDPTLEPPTKKMLGVLFPHSAAKVYNVKLTAGSAPGLRLFVCSEDTVEKVEQVRRVVDLVLQQRCAGIEGGVWDRNSDHGIVLDRLVKTLYADK